MFYNTKIRPVFIRCTPNRDKFMFYSIFLDLRQLIYLLEKAIVTEWQLIRQKGTDDISSVPFAKLYLPI